MKSKDLSFKVITVIATLFALFFFNKINNVINEKDTCVCSYDGFGYYMYNAHLFQEGSYYMTSEWAQQLQNSYCDSQFVYQLIPAKTGNEINIYHIGLSFVQLPAYLLGELSARLFNYPTDGFSIPYHLSYLFNVLVFLFIGLIYVRKLLKWFFEDHIVALTIAVLFLASNIFITFGYQYSLTHLFLFALNAIFLYQLFHYFQSKSRKSLIYSAIFLGLTVCIRPTQVLLGIIPVFLFFQANKGDKLTAIKQLLWFPLFGLIWNIPQLLYWYFIGGKVILPNLHTEDIVLIDPNFFDFLFSYKKGWLLYSPIFLLLILGFIKLYKEKRSFFWMAIVTTFTYIFVMCSWECWWYASSFGSRVMVDIYPFLAIVLGYAFLLFQRKIHLLLIAIYCGLCSVLSITQSYQFQQSILDHERMTKEHYWYIFGKTSIDKYSAIRLEIDRNSTKWIHDLEQYSNVGIASKKSTVLAIQDTLIALPTQDLDIDKFELLSRVPTDETCFLVSFDAKTSDSTQSSILRMETVSKYNCYSWDNIEVSLNGVQNQFTHYELTFNLRNLRHRRDKMQIYVDNDNQVTIEIANLKIEAVSLVR